MTLEQQPTPLVPVTCTVHAPAGAVVAGRPFTLTIDVVSDDGRDLRGAFVKVVDPDTATTQTHTLAHYEDGVNSTGPVEIDPPNLIGLQRWRVVVPPHARGGVRCGGCEAELEFDVVPHPLRVQVWGFPESVSRGERFSVSVGAKGSKGASCAGRPFRLLDASESVVASGVLGDEPRSGSDGLHTATVTFEASAEAGVSRYSCVVDGVDGPVPHAPGTASFSLRVAPDAEHVLTVRVRDHDHDTPIAGAQVVVQPYRCQTDADGVAQVQVSSGEHVLFVAGFAYETYRMSITVEGDLEVDASLIQEPEHDPAEHYA